MKATRQDVAKLAGVSTATVSYVLNRSKPISEETSKRVMEAVEHLNYRPDQIARSMSTHRSMQLGIFLDNISSPYYGDIVQGFEAAASEQSYFVNVCTSHKRFADYFENVISRRLDGLFIMMPPARYDENMLDKMAQNGIPLITSGYRDIDIRRFCSIENDYVSGIRALMRMLKGRGHERIAFLSGLNRDSRYDSRAQAYLDSAQALGLSMGDELLIDTQPGFSTGERDGYELALRLIRTGRKFTAAIFINDLTAIGAYKAFQEAGLRIPEDVAVAGIDGISIGEYITPALTTLSFDKIAFGRKAFELLHTQMTVGSTGYYLNKLTLLERKSTDILRRA